MWEVEIKELTHVANQEVPDRPEEDIARKGTATIYDVARLTGVSPSTVSRALSKPGRISIKTEARIRQVADEIGYRINPIARALPTGRTGTIAVLLSDFTNPVYFDFVRGAERVASSDGIALVLAESQESGEVESDTAERLMPTVDGLVLVGTRLEDVRIRELAARKPLVVVNRVVPGVVSLVPDVEPGISEALALLDALRHRSVAYLAGPPASWMNKRRGETLLAEAGRHGITVVEVTADAPTLDAGRAAMGRVMATGATAVIAYNDLMGIGLLRACQETGIRVPEGLSIIGFDAIFGSDFTTPPLTTVRSPVATLGEAAVRALMSALDGDMGTMPPLLETKLVLRGSTAPASR